MEKQEVQMQFRIFLYQLIKVIFQFNLFPSLNSLKKNKKEARHLPF